MAGAASKPRATRDKESLKTTFFITNSFLRMNLVTTLSKWSQKKGCRSEAQASLGLFRRPED